MRGATTAVLFLCQLGAPGNLLLLLLRCAHAARSSRFTMCWPGGWQYRWQAQAILTWRSRILRSPSFALGRLLLVAVRVWQTGTLTSDRGRCIRVIDAVSCERLRWLAAAETIREIMQLLCDRLPWYQVYVVPLRRAGAKVMHGAGNTVRAGVSTHS